MNETWPLFNNSTNVKGHVTYIDCLKSGTFSGPFGDPKGPWGHSRGYRGSLGLSRSNVGPLKGSQNFPSNLALICGPFAMHIQ